MNTGRKPAQYNVVFRGTRLLSRIQIATRESLTEEGASCQSKKPSDGNKCGHFKYFLKSYTPPRGQKRRFHVLEEALRVIEYAFDHPWEYPFLHGLLHHQQSGRHIRSERVEAEMKLLMPAIADTVNLATGYLGFRRQNGSFHYFNYKTLMARTGMGFYRVKRNMQNLQRYGLISVHRIVQTTTDGIKHKELRIKVQDDFFHMLGLMKELQGDRKKSEHNDEKICKRVKRFSQATRLSDMIGFSIANSSGKKTKKTGDGKKEENLFSRLIINRRPTPDSNVTTREEGRIQARIIDLLPQFPHLTKEQVEKLVRAYTKPPS